jgi:hypothetical protein
MEKSANKRWKESGTSLSFKEWIDRDNKKRESEGGNFLPFNSGIIQDTLDTSKDEIATMSGYKPQANNKLVLGLDKNIVIFAGVLIAGSIGYYFYSKLKNKK